jgi:hypothetical protein
LILAMPFVRVYVFELFFGRCLSGPGYSGLAKARLLLRNEPSPSYPYRNCFILILAMPFVRVYVFELFLGRCFSCLIDFIWTCLFGLGLYLNIFWAMPFRPGLLRAR